jgi:glycosyltransferase involved in cell wall biosynthesis
LAASSTASKQGLLKPEYRMIAMSVVLGVMTWSIDALFDYVKFFKGEKTFLGLLFLGSSDHHIYVRCIELLFFIMFGVYISWNITKRRKAEDELRKVNDRLETRVAEATKELKITVDRLEFELGERRKAEEGRQLEQNKLKCILDTIRDGACIINQQHDISYINPVIEKEFGPVEGRKCHEYFNVLSEVCWESAKWGPAAKAYFRMAARAAILGCDRLITDAKEMQRFYRKTYGADSGCITYGAEIEGSTKPQLLDSIGISPGNYYLVMSRMVPENNVDVMIEGFKKVPTSKKLIIGGGATYDSPFHRRLFAMADDRVLFIGQVNDPDLLRELFCNCYAYLHGHSVGGTNPALLNALGYGCCVIAIDTPFNREVLQGESGNLYGVLFNGEQGLREKIVYLEDRPDLVEKYRMESPKRIREGYEWERIVDQYEILFKGVMEKRTARAPRKSTLESGKITFMKEQARVE